MGIKKSPIRSFQKKEASKKNPRIKKEYDKLKGYGPLEEPAKVKHVWDLRVDHVFRMERIESAIRGLQILGASFVFIFFVLLLAVWK
jgi:hypothetical protein